MSDSTAWLVAKVFVSSTFRDMFSEREALVKRVFPKLRQELLRYRIHLVDYDLRWGITDDQVSEHGAMRACMRVIDESRPLFLGLVGHRYGTSCNDALDWQIGESFGQNAESLRGKSYTELEFLYALRDTMSHAEMDILFMLRDPFQLADLDPMVHDIIADSDTLNRDRIERLREFIPSLSTQAIRMHNYKATFDGLIVPLSECHASTRKTLGGFQTYRGMIYLPNASLNGDILNAVAPMIKAERVFANVGHLEHFETLVYEILMDQILTRHGRKNTHFANASTDTELTDLFVAGKLGFCSYVNRKNSEAELLKYLNGNEYRPMIVMGDEGIGKTTTLSYLFQKYRADPRFRVDGHFAGSGAIPDDLTRVLNVVFRIGDDCSDSEVPVRSIRDALAKLDITKRYLFIIDGVDQLRQPTGNCSLSWLPLELPENVRLLLSINSDSAIGRQLHEAAYSRMNAIIVVQMPELSREEKAEMLLCFAIRTGKTLTSDQQQVLKETHQLHLPLLLEFALSEIRTYGHRESIEEQTACVANNAIGSVLERMAGDFGQEDLNAMLSFLAACRYGISERELRNIFTASGRSMDLFHDLLRSLRPWLQWGPQTINYSHDLIKRAVLEYIPNYDLCLDNCSREISTCIEKSMAECAFLSDTYCRRTAELFWQYSIQKDYNGICKMLEHACCLTGLMNYPDGKLILHNLLHVRGWRRKFLAHLMRGIQAIDPTIDPEVAREACINIHDLSDSLASLEGDPQALSASRELFGILLRHYGNHDITTYQSARERLSRCKSGNALRGAFRALQTHTKCAEDVAHLHRHVAGCCEFLSRRRSIIGLLFKRGIIHEGLRHASEAVDAYAEADDPGMQILSMFIQAELYSHIDGPKALQIYQSALDVSTKIFGRWSSHYTAECYFRMAGIYRDRCGQFSGNIGDDLHQSASCFRSAHSIRAGIFPKDSFDTLKCLYSLIHLYSEILQEHDAAYAIFIQEQDAFDAAAANPFDSDLRGLNAISIMLLRNGKYADAERYCNACQKKRELNAERN